jgi:hypothetical protein
MNAYSVLYVSGEMLEIDADYYQAEGFDLVFFAGTNEALRAPAADIAGVSKISTWPSVSTPSSELVFL